jgi:signal transduction histidine kinase
MVKKLKAGTFLRQSLTAIFVLFLHRIFFRSGSTMQKVVIASILLILLSATVFLAPVVLVVVLVFAPKYVRKYDAIKQGVEEVRNGNLSYQIPVPEGDHSELDDIARNINQISEAVNITVQNELKNQRMKAELISNVSHDLKTPLTSMVTYIDLLKQEGLDSPRAMEYLDVLDNKTNRLRQLTEDLFEAAKAASGAMPVRLEKVELISLINQGLGELNEGINESGLEFILNNPKEKYYVWADGQLMWRVMENILGNVLKYAQPDTRVYMDVREEVGGEGTDPDMVIFEVKNISRQSLNIDAEELMERFKRGDEARSSDGSGLGLSIAKDLVKLQKGVFEVKIDGDLFKSIVVLNRYPELEDSKEEYSPKPPTETLQEES